MPKSERTRMLESIASTVADYRAGEVDPITPEHVDTWISQFVGFDELIILQELDFLLHKYYVPRSRAIGALRRYVGENLIGELIPREALENIDFLDIQTRGSGQKEMLRLLEEEVLEPDYGFSVDQCGVDQPTTFIYIDDALYTGNRIVNDLSVNPRFGEGSSTSPQIDNVAWIDNTASEGATLEVFVLGAHSVGAKHVRRRIGPSLTRSRVTLGGLRTVTHIWNDRSRNESEGYWPREFTGCVAVDELVRSSRKRIQEKGWPDYLWRGDGVPVREETFSSSDGRNIIERAFTSYGAELLVSNTTKNQRPLGWEVLESLGFGSPFVSFRNIANNTPIVLWWVGDGWKPLFPRRNSDPAPS